MKDLLGQRIRYTVEGEPGEGIATVTAYNDDGTQMRLGTRWVRCPLVYVREMLPPEPAAPPPEESVPPAPEPETPKKRRRREHGERQPANWGGLAAGPEEYQEGARSEGRKTEDGNSR